MDSFFFELCVCIMPAGRPGACVYFPFMWRPLACAVCVFLARPTFWVALALNKQRTCGESDRDSVLLVRCCLEGAHKERGGAAPRRRVRDDPSMIVRIGTDICLAFPLRPSFRTSYADLSDTKAAKSMSDAASLFSYCLPVMFLFA